MIRRNFQSIRRRFIVGLVQAISVVLILFSSAIIAYNAISTNKELQNQMERLLQVSQESLASPIWEYHTNYIEEYLASLFLYKEVVYVKLQQDNQENLIQTADGYRPDDFEDKNLTNKVILQSRAIRHKGSQIGTITIGITKERIRHEILYSSLFFIALLFVLNAFVFLTVFKLSQHYLFKPLEDLEGAAKEISRGNLSTVIDTSAEGEIGRLARTFSQMIASLKEITASRDELDREINIRKGVEKALSTSRETLLSVLDGIDATVYVADLESYEILFMNQYMINLYGKDLKGQQCYNVFVDEQGPCTYCSNEKLLDSEGNPTGAHIWSARNKVTGRWFMNHDRAIKWIDGRYVRLQIATDITEFKEMENELRQAHKMESIGRLAGGIAHDFNNILAAINGFSQLALDDVPQDSQAAQDIQEVIKSSNRAAKLVKQILSFSRKQKQELNPVDPGKVITEAIPLLRATLPATITIKTEIAPGCGAVMADATMLHQMLMNLCTNGAHAMEESGGILKISLSQTLLPSNEYSTVDLPDGNYLAIQVADSGTGIKTELLEHIFDPYFTTKEVGKGSGMGLAVVHGVVKSHKGDIVVESNLGVGTSFTIILPEVSSLGESEIVISDELPQGNESILLVDDESKIVKLTERRLSSLGYRVTSTTKSVEALEMFIENPDNFNILISDQTMPSMPGDELAAAIKKIRPHFPVILCSGYSSTLSAEKLASIDIEAFIMKPVQHTTLARTVRDCLDSAQYSSS